MTPADKLEAPQTGAAIRAKHRQASIREAMFDAICNTLELKLGLPWQEALPAARAVAEAIRTELGEAVPVAWASEDGRVVSARTKAAAIRDGGASASAVAIYTIPLYATPPATVPVEALRGLVGKWYVDQGDYPATGCGDHASVAVRACAQELATLIAAQEKK